MRPFTAAWEPLLSSTPPLVGNTSTYAYEHHPNFCPIAFLQGAAGASCAEDWPHESAHVYLYVSHQLSVYCAPGMPECSSACFSPYGRTARRMAARSRSCASSFGPGLSRPGAAAVSA